MTVFEQLLYSIVRIEMFHDSNLSEVGTGFLLHKKNPLQQHPTCYLVSNKHVLDKTNCSRFRIQLHKHINGNVIFGESEFIEINRSEIHEHQNPDIDVAAVDITNKFTAAYAIPIAYEMLSDFQEPELSVGENICFAGYPGGNIFDQKNNLPIIRNGIIASDPKMQYNGSPIFVVDAGVIGGSSGSPVIINLTYENMRCNGVFGVPHQIQFKLLGIISENYVVFSKVLKRKEKTNEYGQKEKSEVYIDLEGTKLIPVEKNKIHQSIPLEFMS